MYRSLARALVLNGKMTTTVEKAKTVKVYVEKLINTARKGTVASRRRLYAALGNSREISDGIVRYVKNKGYIAVVPLPSRKGDAARMARVEMIGWVAKPSFAKASEEQGKKAVEKKEVRKTKTKK